MDEKNSKLFGKERHCQFCFNHYKDVLRKDHDCRYKKRFHTAFCPDCDLIIERRNIDAAFKKLREKTGWKEDEDDLTGTGTVHRLRNMCNLCLNHFRRMPVKGHKHCEFKNQEHRQSCEFCENRYQHRRIMKETIKRKREIAAERAAHRAKQISDEQIDAMQGSPVNQGEQMAKPEIGQFHSTGSGSCQHANRPLPFQQQVNSMPAFQFSPCRYEEADQHGEPSFAASAAGPSPGLPIGATIQAAPRHLLLPTWQHVSVMPPLISRDFYPTSAIAAQEMGRMQQLIAIGQAALLQRPHLSSLFPDSVYAAPNSAPRRWHSANPQ